MNANIKVTAKNANTEALLAHLNHLNAPALGCFHESAYCVKVPVKNPGCLTIKTLCDTDLGPRGDMFKRIM